MNTKTKRKSLTRLMAVLLALAMVASAVCLQASAEKFDFDAPQKAMKVEPKLITVAAHSQGYITPEVLGLTNTTSRDRELPENIDGTVKMSYADAKKMPVLGVFGSDINEKPNPYLYNYFYNTYAAANQQTPTELGTYTLSKDVGGGPMSAAATGGYDKYGTTVPASLYLEPDILIGINPVDDKAHTTGYTQALMAYNEAKKNDYDKKKDPKNDGKVYEPKQVSYQADHVYTFLQTLYELSDVVDEIKQADSSKTTRYDDPQVISGDIEKYVKGLEAYVIEHLKKDGAKPVTVAVVDTAYTKTLRDSATLKPGQYVVNTKDNSTQPTTKFSRVGEFVADTATNIVDAIGGLQEQTGATTNSFPNNYYVVTADQIAQYADVVLFCDVLSAVPENGGNSAVDNFSQDLVSHCSKELKSKARSLDMMSSTFDCVGSIGANSVENLLGMAYYTAYLYPQYLNQFEVAAYWYQNFYHISDLQKLQKVMNNNFATASVQNNYAKTVKISDLQYDEQAIEDKIVEGMNYYEHHKNEFAGKLLNQNGKKGEDGKPDENTGWEIDWTRGIGAGKKLPAGAKWNGLADAADRNGNWWYYTDGKVDPNHSGVESNKNGWWRVENGKVNFKATGIYSNRYGWWRVENGKVNFKANGVYKNQYGWWKTTNGKVTFHETGVFQNEYGWWRVENSKVNFKANGIYQNRYGWWKTTNGKITFKDNGLYKNDFGTWKVENSKVNFHYNGTYHGKNIRNGKVI